MLWFVLAVKTTPGIIVERLLCNPERQVLACYKLSKDIWLLFSNNWCLVGVNWQQSTSHRKHVMGNSSFKVINLLRHGREKSILFKQLYYL